MKKYIIFILPAFLFYGCSVWEDFTTYFNLYYNTVETFDQAEQQLNDQRKDPFAKFDAPIPSNVVPLLDKVIEKCSRILQFNANSSFVDDALLMIGKAFYYQKNYLKALRKFQELIATKGESDLVLEARLWEAKTYFAMSNSQRAIALMETVKKDAIQANDKKILKGAYLEEIRHYLLIEDFDVVLPLLTQFVEFNSDDELNAQVMYQAGEILAQKQDFETAAKYYRSAYRDFSPTNETLFLSRLKEAKMRLFLGNSDLALTSFYLLRDNPKFKEYQDQVELAIGITYIKTNQFDDALALLRRFDTVYTASQQIGNARYVLAQMYEKDLKNYDSASLYYQKAISSNATAEYLPLIRERSNVFNKYNTSIRDYFTNRKTYVYLMYPERFIADSLRFAVDTNAVTENVQKEEQTTSTAQGGFQDRVRDFDNDLNITELLANATAGTTQSVSGAPTRPTITLDSSKSIMARCAIELGNIFLTSLAIPDSAYFYYSEAIQVFGTRHHMPKALYGLAGYYGTINDSVTADSLYRSIYNNHKDDKLVNEVAKKINMPLIDFEYDPAKDLYFQAEDLFLKGRDSLAFEKFSGIVSNHPKSKYYQQAMYATGYLLENSFKLRDSAATVYDTLVTKFPGSVYAQKVQPKLQFYKDEKARIQQLIADSIRHVQDSLKRIQDSIKADSIAKFTRDSLELVNKSNKAIDSLGVRSDSLKANETPVKEKPEAVTPENPQPPVTEPEKKEEVPQQAAPAAPGVLPAPNGETPPPDKVPDTAPNKKQSAFCWSQYDYRPIIT